MIPKSGRRFPDKIMPNKMEIKGAMRPIEGAALRLAV